MLLILATALAASATPRCPLEGAYDPANPFARIVRGELPASRVFEDRQVIVILPLDWTNPGHALVIPKRPVRNLDAMTPREMAHALSIARRVATAQRVALGATGYSIIQNNARNQDVCQAHFHVVPDTPPVPTGGKTRAEMDALAAKLRAAFPR